MMKIVIPGNPVATMRTKCMCLGGHGHVYDHKTQKDNMKRVRSIILDEWNKYFDSPKGENFCAISYAAYAVVFEFYMPIAKSETKSIANLKLWGLIPCTDKPDFDNLAKLYADCAIGIIWKDDCQIHCGISHKVRFSLNPRTEITVIRHNEIKLNDCENTVFKTFNPIELKELMLQAEQIGNLYGIYRSYLEDNSNLPTDAFFSQTAVHIAKFATDFSDKLKKVAKQIQ